MTNHPAEWAREFDREFNGELWLGCEGDLEPQRDRVELKDFIRTLLIKQRDETLEEAAKAAENFPNYSICNRPRPKNGWRYLTKEKQKRIANTIRQLKSKQENKS